MITRACFRNAVAGCVLALFATASVPAFQDPPSDQTPAELLKDFTHYALTANINLASSSAEALLASGITDAELAVLVDEGKEHERFDRAIARSQPVPELQDVVSQLAKRVENGRLDLARDPKRIDEAITMLSGTQKARLTAENRLIAAGEYAIPALLTALTEGANEELKQRITTIIPKIGLPAVTPLSVALSRIGPGPQRIVCDLLGEIGYPHAAPYLRDVASNPATPTPVREAAERALSRIKSPDLSVSQSYSDLGRLYFDGGGSLVAYPLEATNNVWSYNDFTGLEPMPVPTEIFNEVMAMKLAVKGVELDPANTDALSLFVASDLKRENDMPEGAADPIYGENKYTPEFYATVFGTQIALNVLGMGIDKLDTPLVRDAIDALARTTGGSNLFAKGQGRQPLLEALQYPDRRVQYDAALTLGRALPQEKFAGDQNVVPLLASAVRLGNKSFALVISDDGENRAAQAGQLEQLGFEIVGTGAQAEDVQVEVNQSPGVDLVVVRMGSAAETKAAVDRLRNSPKTAAAPVLIIATGSDQPMLRVDYRDDSRVRVERFNQEAFGGAVEQVMLSGAGGRMTDAQAEEYAARALETLRHIAISGTPAYDIADAEGALLDALTSRTGGSRIEVASILALIDSDRAQRSLFDAALAATDDEQVALLGHLSDSVKRFGDKAEKRHVEALVQLVANSGGDTAEAAARVHGALNLPSTDALQLLPQSAQPAASAQK